MSKYLSRILALAVSTSFALSASFGDEPAARQRIQQFRQDARSVKLPEIRGRSVPRLSNRTLPAKRNALELQKTQSSYLRQQRHMEQALAGKKDKPDLTLTPTERTLTAEQKAHIKRNRVIGRKGTPNKPFPARILPPQESLKRSGNGNAKSESGQGLQGNGAQEYFISDPLNFSYLDYVNYMQYVFWGSFIAPSGADYIKIEFDYIDLESTYDKVYVVDQWGYECDMFTGSWGQVQSAACEGDYAEIIIYTDGSFAGERYDGFYIAGYTYGYSVNYSEPVAIAFADRYSDTIGGRFYFDGYDSYAVTPGATIVEYDWDFGDGTGDNSGALVNHDYLAPGTYWVTLTVTDSNGYWSQDSFPITIYPISVPTNLRVTSTDYRSMGVAWNSGGNDNYGYVVAIGVGHNNNSVACRNGVDVGTSQSYTFTGLTPGANYTAIVCSYNGYDYLSEARRINITTRSLPPPPPAPNSFQVTEKSVSTIEVSWSNGGGSTVGYWIAINQGSSARTCTSGQFLNSSRTSYEYTGLTFDTTYTVSICSVNDAEVASAQRTVSATTDLPLPPNPSNFRVTSSTGNGITLGWSSGGGSTTGFKVAMAQGTTPPACSGGTSLSQGSTSHTFNGLTPSTTYAFSICAHNRLQQYSGQLTASGATQIADPNSPTAFVVSNKTANSLTATWASGGGTTNGFRIAINAGNNPAVCTSGTSLGKDVTTHTFNGLSGETTYTLSLCAVNAVNVPSVQLNASGTTLPGPAPAPTNFRVTATTASSITLAWASGGASTHDFVIAMATGSAPTCTNGTTVAKTQTTYTFSGLQQNTTYQFAICARNSLNQASSPARTSGVTKQGPPPPPVNFKVVGTTKKSIQVSWASGGGNTSGFKIAIKAGSVAPGCGSGTSKAANVTTHTFKNLRARTTYSMSLCSINSLNTLSAPTSLKTRTK